MSKGSKRRPHVVSDEQFAKNWAAIFGVQHKPTEQQPDGVVNVWTITQLSLPIGDAKVKKPKPDSLKT